MSDSEYRVAGGDSSPPVGHSPAKHQVSPWSRPPLDQRAHRAASRPAWHPLYVRRLAKEDRHGRPLSPRNSTERPAFNVLASILVRDRQRALTVDPTASATPGVPRGTRRLCGRWLIVQCLRLGRAIEDCAAQAGVDAATITELTLGLADDFNALDDRWSTLAAQLANTLYDTDFVQAVIRLAGGDESVSEQVAAQVARDLEPPS